MKNIAKIIIFFLLTTIIFSCYKHVEFTEFKSVDVDLKKNDGKITLFVKIKNPNFYKVKIVETDLKVYMNDNFLGDVTDIDEIVLPAKNETIVEIPLKINIMNILFNAGNISSFFSNSEDVLIRIKGDVVGKTIFGKKEMTIDQEKSIKNNK